MDRWLSVLWGFVTAGGRAPTLSSFPHPGRCHHQGCPVERRRRLASPRSPRPFSLIPLTFACHLQLGLQLRFGHVVPTLSSATSPLYGTCPLGWSSLCTGCRGARAGRGGPCPPLPQQSRWCCWRGESSGGRGAGPPLAASTRWRRRARGRLPCTGDRNYLSTGPLLLPWPWFRNGALALYPKWIGLLG